MGEAIAIIGGGCSGTALAIHLLRKAHRGLTIHVIEPRDALGLGIAYGDADRSHILNVPADRMSLWSDRPRQFLDWARQHGPRHGWRDAGGAVADSYLSRQLFGHYVQFELSEAVAAAQAAGGPSLVHHRTSALGLRRQGRDWEVDTAAGGWVRAGTVVLATGFRPPAVPFPVEGSGPAFVDDPWAQGAVGRIGRDDSVLIVGTGLTMVDMIYSLTAAGHRGQVTAISRHGLLPRVHGISSPLASVLTPEDTAKGVVYALRTLRNAVAWGRSDWRTVIDGLRPVTNLLWAALPPAEQARFLRHLRPLWEVHRHRMPAESADLLLRRVAQGRLAVEAARIERLSLDGEGAVALLRGRGAAKASARRFDWVINCTPPAPPFAEPLEPLVGFLVKHGLARPHASGLGFDVDDRGLLRDAAGAPVDGAFVLGPPRRGHAVEATAVPHIRPQIEDLTAQVLERLGERSAAAVAVA